MPVRDKALVSGVGLNYFVLVFNGSDLLAVTGRDKDATWRTLGTLCRERDWSKPRLIYELQNGLRYRTIPGEYVVDWHDAEVLRTLDVAASTVTPILGVLDVPGGIGFDAPVLGIEVLPPGVEVSPPMDEVPAPSANAPAASPASPRGVSEADLRQCLLDIVDEHPPGTPPLDEKALHAKLENRLGAPVKRDRFRAARDEVAPGFKRPRGRARKNPQ